MTPEEEEWRWADLLHTPFTVFQETKLARMERITFLNIILRKCIAGIFTNLNSGCSCR
jgi:hypothetical protein